MPALPIVRYPDPRLNTMAAPVEVFNASLRALAADLADTMREAPAIGITAPHVGVLQRLVLLRLTPEETPHAYVNPSIVWASDERLRHTEGSVSLPGVTEEVERHARVRISYRDLDGNEQTEDADGFRAVCHQHEIDQLDGVFWIQRLSRLKRDRLLKRYARVARTS
ncbi:peptide deformylase [Bradyrhizobium sp. 2TAF24]|uniref:peptide deformylase n=1 Tax=Bradyrhizobium sp. 2TAF24 TaxID=3233011 RepID=UPI003F90DD0F